MENTEKIQTVKNVVKEHYGEIGGILSILEEIQGKYGYLSADTLKVVSEETGHSMEDLYGVATFFKAFSLTPRGKHVISICVGTACHVRGAPVIVSQVEELLGIKDGETTPDRKFTIETVRCLGACALGPIIVVDGHYFSNVKKTEVQDIIEKTLAGLDKVDIATDERIFPIEVNCPRCNRSLMDEDHLVDGHPSIHLNITSKQGEGWVRLSSLYGSYSHESEFPVPETEAVEFSCPHCKEYLTGPKNCPICEVPMVPMSVGGEGIVQICSRRGCKEHMLDLLSTSAAHL